MKDTEQGPIGFFLHIQEWLFPDTWNDFHCNHIFAVFYSV